MSYYSTVSVTTGYSDDRTVTSESYTMSPEPFFETIWIEPAKTIYELFSKITRLFIPYSQFVRRPEVRRRLMFSLSGWLLKIGRLKRKGN